MKVAKLAGVVVATCLVCWLPYLTSLQATAEVVERLTPIDRGLFEDYVANFWCVTSMLLKWRNIFSQQAIFATPL